MLQHRKPRWRRFRPRQHAHRHDEYRRRDVRQDKHYTVAPEDPQFVCNTTDIFDCAEDRVRSMMQRRPEPRDLDTRADMLKKRFERTRQPLDGLAALFAQAPRASLAQVQMDKHPHGYHDKQARLYELIDFNDTFDLVVLSLSDTHRAEFTERAKQAMDRTCKRVGAPCFSDEQWQAIVRGLSCEIAVYLAAKNSGFHTIMTGRSQDALGVDIQVMDPETHRYINLDIKSPSAFRHRLEQLVKENRITEKELLAADERSYTITTNGRGKNKVRVVLFSVLPDYYGEIEDFRFIDEAAVRERINQLIRDYGLSDGRFGMISI